VDELIDMLDASADVEDCYSLSWLRYTYGLKEGGESSCVVQHMRGALTQSGGSIGAIFATLTQADQFYARTGDPTYAPPPGAAWEPAVAGAPGADATGGDPGTQAPAGLATEVTQSNDWGGGYCKTYQLTNKSDAPITWSVTLMVDGKMNNHWECEVSGDTGSVMFSGAQHNASLTPGAQAQFGFCATR
jgi:cellulase/cellobiase CelA1